MCMTCRVTSALLFTPSGSDLSLNASRQIPLPQDVRVAITEVVKRVPATAETQDLRQGLQTLHARLASA